MARFVLFIEVVRAMDYWGMHAPALTGDGEEITQSLDLMYWGWNRAIAELFVPLELSGVPLVESTQKSRRYAAALMREFGKVSLLHRLADMNKQGIMEIAKDGDEFQIRISEEALAQFADATEFDRLKAAQARMPSSNVGWTLASMKDIWHFSNMPGNYMAMDDNAQFKPWLRHDIEELIKPLVRPWDIGRGIMVAYDARIEVDEHYMAEALTLTIPWREDAGIHPKAMLGSITGADITGVGAALVSLHVKHFACVSVAKKLFDQVSVAQSLTIWTARDELEETVSIISGCSGPVVHAAFNALAMTSEQAKKLADHSTPLIPLLFDLGNGFILRPVSSVTRNPFNAVKTQHKWLDPRAEHAIAADRERWMREHLYAMFGGSRYICFPGNLKLRRGGAVLTDVDAVIYDRLTGDVGLFQLKWQDYATNDVRQLRSKATNLSAELADWSGKVKSWIEENGISGLDKSLQLKRKRREVVRGVLLFAISRSSVRTQGYGVKTDAPDLVMAVWSQFARARMDVGPSERSLRDIHALLLDEHGKVPNVYPMKTSIRVANATLHIHDLWNRIDTGGEASGGASPESTLL